MCGLYSCFSGHVLTYCFESSVKAHGTLNIWEEGVDRQAVDEIKQHFGVVAEGLESKIEIIAEGHALLRAEMKNSIKEFRSEVRESFGDVRSMIKLSNTEIDTRINTLEREFASLKARVEEVEAGIR